MTVTARGLCWCVEEICEFVVTIATAELDEDDLAKRINWDGENLAYGIVYVQNLQIQVSAVEIRIHNDLVALVGALYLQDALRGQRGGGQHNPFFQYFRRDCHAAVVIARTPMRGTAITDRERVLQSAKPVGKFHRPVPLT